MGWTGWTCSGPWAGEVDRDSDIDVLYELAPGSRHGWNIEDLADEFCRLVGRRVDLVSCNALSERLRDNVLMELARSMRRDSLLMGE